MRTGGRYWIGVPGAIVPAAAKVGVATSTGVCGRYTYRGSFRPLGQQSRDIGLFQDADGSGYLLTEDRAHGLRIDRLSPAGPWAGWRTFAPAGTRTFDNQTANVITVHGSRPTTYVYAGDRGNPADLGNSPLVWLPLSIDATRVSLAWHDTWHIDTATGTWS
jgi:hypothetical protein